MQMDANTLWIAIGTILTTLLAVIGFYINNSHQVSTKFNDLWKDNTRLRKELNEKEDKLRDEFIEALKTYKEDQQRICDGHKSESNGLLQRMENSFNLTTNRIETKLDTLISALAQAKIEGK